MYSLFYNYSASLLKHCSSKKVVKTDAAVKQLA